MRCPSCSHDNRAERRFCAECGAALAALCAACGVSNEPGEKFCGGCGASLREPAPVPHARAPAAPPDLAPALAIASPPPARPSAPPRPRHRLAAVDWLLVGTLLPLFVFGLVMVVVHGIRGDFVLVPFWVSSAADAQSYPVVRRIDYATPGVAVGDGVVSLEGVDLRGVSAATFIMRWAKAAVGSHLLRFTIEHGATRSAAYLPLVPDPVPWWMPLPFALSQVGVALFLLVRADRWRPARRFYVASSIFAIDVLLSLGAPLSAPRLWIILKTLGMPLAYGLTVWTAFEFIPAALPLQRWQQAVPWGFAIFASVQAISALWLPAAGPAATLMRLHPLVGIGFAIALLGAVSRAYWRSDSIGRRQVKWVVYGVYVGMLPSAIYSVLQVVSAVWADYLWGATTLAAVAVPLGILVSVAFYQFLDIDRLFSATLSYSVLAIVGLAVVLGVMPTVSQAASDALGLAPAYGQILFAFALAAMIVPVQRLVRPRIDRLLFPQRLALEQGFERLHAAISSCADIQELTRLVGERLDALLEPAAAVVYARAGDVFTPLAVRGRVGPPAFAAQSTLITTLQERTTPLAAERWTARRSTSLTPFERAAIETLEVAVLVPFRRDADLIAFVCLGPKRSGDIYTPTDLAWLGAVAGKVSDRLLALDATAVAEQARAMQEALRRYVPGAVAARLASGQDIEAGEREVTVLFVDIRGYTGFSEARQAEEIFHTVNRYTEMVSQVVRARGGSVVEFHGDGLLAVFGAPDEMAMKERAAVQVGCEIVAAMAALPAPAASLSNVSNLAARSEPTASGRLTETPAAGPLSVGVGIGTGPAFVGNIQSSDRFIWTVIGDTVNLAARLQSLTRELDAAVAIDDTTFRRAGRETCAAFVRHADLAIRGRAQPETVHALPL